MLSTAKVRGLHEGPHEGPPPESPASPSRRRKKGAKGIEMTAGGTTLRVTWVGKFRQLLQLRKGQVCDRQRRQQEGQQYQQQYQQQQAGLHTGRRLPVEVCDVGC